MDSNAVLLNPKIPKKRHPYGACVSHGVANMLK